MAKRKKRTRGGLAPDKYLSERQVKRLRRYLTDQVVLAEQRGGRIRAYIDQFIVELLLASGLRASELCELNIEDLPQPHGKDGLFVRNGKGKVKRSVMVSEKAVSLVAKWLKYHRAKARPRQPLLVNERGGRFSYGSLYSKIARIGEQAGIGKLHPHMLRHTYAMRLYSAEHDLRAVQDQLGHSDPKITAIYARTSPVALKRQLAKMDEAP